MTPLRNLVLAGGFVTGATCAGDNDFAAGGPEGGGIEIAGIPPGAIVAEAWMWYVVDDRISPVEGGRPTVNGLEVPYVRVGEVDRSPCFVHNRTAVFRADVSGVVTGDGTYAVAGLPSNPTGSKDEWPFTEGATIVAVYCGTSGDCRRIVILDGIDVTDGAHLQHEQTIDGFGPVRDIGRTTLLAVIGNGQVAPPPPSTADPDFLYVNGTLLEALYPTADVLSGNACPGRRNLGWWDKGLFDVTSLVPAGSTSMTVLTEWSVAASDCYSFAAYVVEADVDAPPEACTPCKAAIAADADCVPSAWCEGAAPPVCTAEGSSSTGCVTGRLEYRWWKDAAGTGTLVRDWSTDPQYSPGAEAVAGPNTYTVEVRCEGQSCALEATDVVVTMIDCPTAVTYGYAAAVRRDQGVKVSWSTLAESGTLGFRIRARDGSGGATTLEGFTPARGAASQYEAWDLRHDARSGRTGAYQIVEVSSGGEGDVTLWIRVQDADSQPPRSIRRSRANGRGGP